MDKPTSKRVGVSRFSGSGRNQVKPGTVKWYKDNVAERFNNTKIALRNTGGFSDHDAEKIAARVLRWNEGRQPVINDELLRKEQARLFALEKLSNYKQEE